MNPNPTAVPGAFCATHRMAPANMTCARCGNFMCWDCSQGGTLSNCPGCAALLGTDGNFPFDRDNQEGLISHAWEVFSRDWVMLSLTSLIFFAVVFGAAMIGSIVQLAVGGGAGALARNTSAGSVAVVFVGMAISQLISMTAQGVMTMGFVRVVYNAIRGRGVQIGDLFSQASKIGSFLLQWIMMFLIVVVPLAVVAGGIGGAVYFATRGGQGHVGMAEALVVPLLLVLPVLMFVMIPIFFASYELALNDNVSAWGAITNVWKIFSGRRWLTIGFSLVGGIAMIIGAMMCGIGMLPAMGFMHVLMVSLFLALRSGLELPELAR